MRFIKTHVPKNLHKFKPERADDDDGDFTVVGGANTRAVVCEDRETTLTPLGLLDPSGAPLYRVLIPLERPIGFHALHPDDPGELYVAYITTEGDWRMSQTASAQYDEYDE